MRRGISLYPNCIHDMPMPCRAEGPLAYEAHHQLYIETEPLATVPQGPEGYHDRPAQGRTTLKAFWHHQI